MTRSKKARRRELDSDHTGWGPWANLHDDLLGLVAKRLGVIDYLAFGGVCKSWRSSAVARKENFMALQPPFLASISVYAKKACYMYSISNGKRYRTMLADLKRKAIWGFSCGYLIMVDKDNHRFRLVNLITRVELHFPGLPLPHISYKPSSSRVILCYSSLLSDFVLVVVFRSDKYLQFCPSGDAKWTTYSYADKPWVVADLAVFRGRLYVLTNRARIGVLKLNPHNPVLTLLEVGCTPNFCNHTLQLVTSNENLYMIDLHHMRVVGIFQLDFTRMEWARITSLGEETLFLSDATCSSTIYNTIQWGFPGNHKHYLRCLSIRDSRNSSDFRWFGQLSLPRENNVSKLDRLLWYFPHQCYSNNLLDDADDDA